MILADKIIHLRKKHNLSQEELAMQMKVSRQAVSKWEQAQSIPDLDKILLMASIFGVSTDYLLKDEIEMEEYVDDQSYDYQTRRVTLQEANDYLALQNNSSKWIALAVALIICSPIPLITMNNLVELNYLGNPESVSAIGISIVIILVALAVGMILMVSTKTKHYTYIEKEIFEVEYGVESMVKQKQTNFEPTHARAKIIGILLFILAVLPVLAIQITNHEFLYISGVPILLLMVACGVFLLIWVGIPWGAMQKLLQEGDYSRKSKKRNPLIGAVAGIYWLLATIIYFAYVFKTNSWATAWMVWPIAGLLFAALMIILNAFLDQKDK